MIGIQLDGTYPLEMFMIVQHLQKMTAINLGINGDNADKNEMQIKVKGDDNVLTHCVSTVGTGMYECERAMKGHYIELSHGTNYASQDKYMYVCELKIFSIPNVFGRFHSRVTTPTWIQSSSAP